MVKQLDTVGPGWERGAVVFDSERRKVGEYQDNSGPYALLRPLGGGREWEAEFGWLREATAEERLSAELRAANERSERRP